MGRLLMLFLLFGFVAAINCCIRSGRSDSHDHRDGDRLENHNRPENPDRPGDGERPGDHDRSEGLERPGLRPGDRPEDHD